MTKILVIEDEIVVGEMISMYLTDEGFEVLRVETGRAGQEALSSFQPDAVLLDLVLPDIDGTDWCAAARRLSEVPILVISTKSKVVERIEALDAGADDYLCKPFSMQELKARIGAAVRRTKPTAIASGPDGPPPPEPAEPPSAIRMDLHKRQIFVDETPIETTFTEFELMKLFFEFPGRVFSRDELINTVRGIDSYVNDRAIDVHITNLRRKFEANPKEPRYLKTVWGVGYKLLLG
ncbi:response regulator transcription factor [Cohnella nanjingensis]|uniref:Response regulator transcription factor n=1 Tax=Cohnella nanjingensis TaxID=1387779 RepID=A0A7X0RP80_9BACL|nr:response regulator transcription factor [Cohnella nanjingensis]